ncbi:RING-H2 finger protein ATL1-like [Carya illinoinensis]|nr:RING-H2 finger protein ATL1-like [Carya illinoinensis]
MGLPFVSTKFPKLTLHVITSQNLFPGNLVKEFILVLLFSCLSLLRQLFFFRDGEDIRPSPSLVPVPFHFIVESIKRHLPSVQYGDILKRRGICIAKECICIVCMNSIEASDGVRELCNCCHVFHKECLDVWIGQGHATCPLCRAKLFPLIQREELGTLGGDPWRMERMVYLFGEDYVMGTS